MSETNGFGQSIIPHSQRDGDERWRARMDENMVYKMELVKMRRAYADHHPGAEWRARAERGGKDWNAEGSTPEQAVDRLIAFMRGRHAFDA